ncbi:xanthine dehydrogenase family protein molybdopterin-binding subunit [Leadbetterella byssophila]|uniref:xanthine dehydrogenase family protein molybdopterin-binding subunit n=1 Tax=Leadbetterella byssophila TaxID=316068 RepID=UPI00399EF015
MSRVEALEKVTGRGKYAAEYTVPGVVHAVMVGSTIPHGKIKRINTEKAKRAEGVLEIITHEHKPLVHGLSTEALIQETRFGLPVFHTDTIQFKGQPIALVVAETLEEARYAASLIQAEYEVLPYEVDFDAARKKVALNPAGKDRGEGWKEAAHSVEAEYHIATEVHHPMEMHATIAHWVDDTHLKLYDKNQGVNNVQRTIGRLFNIPPQNIEVFSEFVGGGFGSGLRVWSNALAAVMAAKAVKRPVKLMLTRQQMFSLAGYRPAAWQKVKMSADAQGKLVSVHHQAQNATSQYERFSDGITRVTRLIYHIPNVRTEESIVPLHMSTPTWMRGPGDCTGDFAIESALDELSYKLKIDPVDFRYRNLALDKHPESGLPWSTNYVKECVEIGARKIGWDKRSPEVGKIKEGDWQIGYGMAVGAWNAGRGNASAGMSLDAKGNLIVKTAMTDIGTGTGTGMMNMAQEFLGIPTHKIKVELGHSSLPSAGSQGGSTGLSSISGAVNAAANELKGVLLTLAQKIDASFGTAQAKDLRLSEAGLVFGDKQISYEKLIAQNKDQAIEVEASSGPGEERRKYAFLSSAAHFVKLGVHAQTGKVKILQYVCVADGGKIVNTQAAANQMSGAVVGGIGMALMEEAVVDPKAGGWIGDDFAGYHFAVNADAPLIEIEFVNKPDVNINPSGAKGLGEVGIIGAAAAISNAIYHATGKRLRSLPITPDKILA